METRANHIVIGLFALAVIASAMAFIYWVAEISGQDQTAEVIFQFDGPINGLSTGSPVLFNGIQVGEVRTLSLNPNDPGQALALAVVALDAPIRADTRASLGTAGITGTAYIDLQGGTLATARVLDPLEPAIIEARSSGIQDLIAGARDILARANSAMDTIETFLDVNEPQLTQTITDINRITSTVASQSDNIALVMEGMGTIAQEISGLSGRLEGVIAGSEALIAAVEPESVSEVVENVRVASIELRGIGDDARALIGRGDVVMDNLDASSTTLAETLSAAQAVVEAVDPNQVQQVIADVGTFAADLPPTGQRLQTLLDDANQATQDVTAFTGRLQDNADEVDAIFENAVLVAERLELASRRIDGLLTSVDGLLGEDETQGLIADAREAARAIRTVAVAFEGRSDEIASGLARFTGPGLRDAEALIGDGRRVLRRLERVVSSIERNPQQFIFGSERAPEYAPQRR